MSERHQPRAWTVERDQWRFTSRSRIMDRLKILEKPVVTIENWSVVGSIIYYGFRRLEPGARLTGDVMGHANLRNGTIYTSAILSIDAANEIVETHNSLYRLGEPCVDYTRWLDAQEKPRAA
jgi:hypothetical protein